VKNTIKVTLKRITITIVIVRNKGDYMSKGPWHYRFRFHMVHMTNKNEWFSLLDNYESKGETISLGDDKVHRFIVWVS